MCRWFYNNYTDIHKSPGDPAVRGALRGSHYIYNMRHLDGLASSTVISEYFVCHSECLFVHTGVRARLKER